MTGSFLDDLKAIRATVLAQSHKDLPVQGSTDLYVRFRPPTDQDRLVEIVGAYKVLAALPPKLACQLIVDCCDEIMRKDPDSGELVPRDPDGGPLRFDAGDDRWGTDVKTAHDCVGKLYNLDQQPLALAGPTAILIDWLQGLDSFVTARVEGKSGSAADS